MLLESVLRGVEIRDHHIAKDSSVSGLHFDSREIQTGEGFIARKGLQNDGHAYIPTALQRGASLVVLEDAPGPTLLKSGVSWVQVGDSDAALARMASNFHGEPTTEMDVIGITGTNGKTSTAFLAERALQQCGRITGLIGTVVQRWPGVSEEANMTTPNALRVQETARKMQDAGVDSMILEVSSHAIEQRRVEGVDFTLGAFTNLSQDHLDYHGTMEDYARTKERFFTELLPASPSVRGAVINVDDPVGKEFANRTPVPVLRYGLDSQTGLQLTAENIVSDLNGTRATLVSDWGRATLSTHLVGRYNLMNLLTAVGCGLLLEESLEDLVSNMADLDAIPGRMNRIPGGDITVFVDYAHTDDALRSVLGSLRDLTQDRIITVFGCGGDRDTLKRGPMGRAALEGSDVVILTSDNPRFEDPDSILDDVVRGMGTATEFDGNQGFFREVDRERAIHRAVDLARSGDVVLIAGKGHESYQDIRGEKRPFNDRSVGKSALSMRQGRFV